jgi:hypothetical protein
VGGEVVRFVTCECHEVSSLKAKNINLKLALVEEKKKSQKFEASSNIYAFELGKALKRLSNAEEKLKIVSNSFQFLRAGVSGFSTDLNMAIDSLNSNV